MQQSEWRHPGEKTKTSDQGKQQDCQLIDLCPRLNIANNRSLLMDSEWSKGALMVKAYFRNRAEFSSSLVLISLSAMNKKAVLPTQNSFLFLAYLMLKHRDKISVIRNC